MPAGLNATTCATAIVNRITAGQSIPDDTKSTMQQSWLKIIDELFNHIIANMKVTVTIPQIPTANFTVNMTATVTIGGTPYPVDFSVKTISDTTIPPNTVAIL